MYVYLINVQLFRLKMDYVSCMSESLIFNFSSTQDACFDRLGTEIYSKTPVFKELYNYIRNYSQTSISIICGTTTWEEYIL